jgi:FAD-linked sulfhydryl oxidase
MIISRFTKSFLILIIVLFSLASLLVLRRPILAYKDPWSGQFFGEGGVEVHDVSGNVVPYQGVEGAVIMGKLGNKTAK